MFLNRISIYYCLCCPPPSFIIFVRHSLLIHEFLRPLFSVYNFPRVEVACIFLCGAVRPTASQCMNTAVPPSPPPGNVPTLSACLPFFFKALICSDKRLISCCYRATVSTEIARLAANSASGPPFSEVCVDAAAIFFRYPSSESII